MTAILKHKRNRKFDFFSVRIIFILFMNTKVIFSLVTSAQATHKNSAIGVHLMNLKMDLTCTLKKSNIHYSLVKDFFTYHIYL